MTPDPAPDQARLIPLMWRPRDRASRTGLSIGAITSAAVGLADVHGAGAVTMRAVAEILGVGTMSLYTHVPGKPELWALMNDAVLGEIYADGRLPRDAGEWPDRLRFVAERNWKSIMRHPWRAQAEPGGQAMGPGLVGKYEHELGAVEGIGLTDVDMDSAIALVNSHVTASASWYLAERSDPKQRAMTAEEWGEHTRREWAERLGPALGAAMAARAGDYPLASRVGEAAATAYAGADPQVLMDFGLAMIIAGLRERIAASQVG